MITSTHNSAGPIQNRDRGSNVAFSTFSAHSLADIDDFPITLACSLSRSIKTCHGEIGLHTVLQYIIRDVRYCYTQLACHSLPCYQVKHSEQ